ncbi:MAG: hypothetical protein LC689_05420, partial [Myxococcales bacterium]|nr:hypothetical protein [Myxococcales bacterium]
EYMQRVIHYDVPPGQECMRAGGVDRKMVVPHSVAFSLRMFCFPRVIVENWDAYYAGDIGKDRD